MRILAAVLVILLIAGAAIVFIRAQVLKNAPSPIVAPTIDNRVFSPEAFKLRRRTATLTVGLRRATPATVVILDQSDKEIAEATMEQKGRRIRAAWDGRLASGALAEDGVYRFAIRLPKLERTIRIPDAIRLDATPPVVESTAKSGLYISPGLDGGTGTYTFTLTASERVRFRLDVRQIQPSGAARLIRRETDITWAQRKQMRWAADAGNLPLNEVGDFVEPGSYIVGWRAEDRAGNLIVAPTVVEPGQLAPARVVGVRTVALTPRLQPITLLSDVALVRHRPDAAFPGSTVARAQGAPGAVRLPRAIAGFYAVEISGNGWQGWAPESVAGRAPVLVMTPMYSWQAENPADADLSGFPAVPPDPLSLSRPFPNTVTNKLAAHGRTVTAVRTGLDRNVGAITDANIERRGVPTGTRLLVIADAPVWTEGLLKSLRRYQNRGGQILIIGSTSLTQEARRSGSAITLLERTAPTGDPLATASTLDEATRVLGAGR